MILSLLPLAAAHADPTPHVHGASPLGLVILGAWVALAAVLGAVWWRRKAA